MKTGLGHSWKVSPSQAIEIQKELAGKLILRPPPGPIRRMAAGDAAYSREDDRIYAAVLVFSYPELILLESATSRGAASFPYIPGLFSFREGPVLLKAFSELKTRPDWILVEGQGIAHPRSLGIASHLGLLLDLPSTGCAKSRLYGEDARPGPNRGSSVPLVAEGRIVGMILRTRTGVKPVYVSPGHKMDLESSVKMVLSLCRGYRIPEPLRQAHMVVNRMRG